MTNNHIIEVYNILNNEKPNYEISDKDQHINELNNQLFSIKTDLINTLHKNTSQ